MNEKSSAAFRCHVIDAQPMKTPLGFITHVQHMIFMHSVMLTQMDNKIEYLLYLQTPNCFFAMHNYIVIKDV